MEITKEEFDRYFKAYCPIPIKKSSKWEFNTSASAAGGVGFLAASGGFIQLISPSKSLANFHYIGAGAGWSWGGRLPKIPKLPKIDLKGYAGAGSITDFDSVGTVQITESFKGDELMADDLSGPCVFMDGGAGLGGGGGATFFLLGISPHKIAMLASTLATPIGSLLVAEVLKSAKAVLVVTGWNVGAQIGMGVSGNLGMFKLQGPEVGRQVKHGIYSPERQAQINEMKKNPRNPGATTPFSPELQAQIDEKKKNLSFLPR